MSRAAATAARLTPTLPISAMDILTLSKYRLSGLVALTATAGYLVRADRGDPVATARGATFATVGTFLSAACANTLNQLYERHSDARMARTRLRPLPGGRVSAAAAAAFAAATGLAGVTLLAVETNSTATALGAANIALYAGVYTPLKAVSLANTWVGAVVGAIPPMLGWAAASGGDLRGPRERGAWAFGGLLFLWQIPHFHALAVLARADYARAGLRMLAVSDPAANAAWARRTAACLVPAGAVLAAVDVTHDVFALEAGVLGAWMYRGAGRLAADPTAAAAARPLFRASIVHLPAIMALMLLHRTSPAEREVAHAAWYARREAAKAEAVAAVTAGGAPVFYHPWETLAPFPFLPLPMLVPAAAQDSGAKSRCPAAALSSALPSAAVAEAVNEELVRR